MMKEKELIQLKLGQYELTDGIYFYTLSVGKSKDRTKYYRIKQKGTGSFDPSIFMSQGIIKDEDGKKLKCLSASSHVGGLFVHSYDNYSMLSRLKFVEGIEECTPSTK